MDEKIEGLTEKEVLESLKLNGKNIISVEKGHPVLKRLKEAFINPFTIILTILSIKRELFPFN